MVTKLQITGMVIQILIAILAPLAIFAYLALKKSLSWKSLGLGIVIFMLFTQILEKTFHLFVIDPSGPSLKWTDSSTAYIIYGALAAGVFGEVGRFVGFRFLNKKRWEYKDGLSFGLGYGAIEAMLVSVFAGMSSLMFVRLINSGTLEQTVGASVPPEQLAFIKEQLLNTTFSLYVLGGFERIPALFIHIALSLLVLLAVREGRYIYVIYAIGLHAIVNFVPAMYQNGMIQQIWVIESIIALLGIAAIIFIMKSKKLFKVSLDVSTSKK
ncbi:MAG TPA: YhfC family intramembrane metalloprotease [Bacillus bacterium]|nr:YhfC family intramembrane metalloprotease [Bacillus sp. (in: firmicutes)]